MCICIYIRKRIFDFVVVAAECRGKARFKRRKKKKKAPVLGS